MELRNKVSEDEAPELEIGVVFGHSLEEMDRVLADDIVRDDDVWDADTP